MVQFCVVPKCRNNARTPGVSFFSFPKDKSLRKSWVIKIRRDDRKCAEISDTMRVCSAHFEEQDFILSKNGKRRLLKKDAFPTIFKFTSPRKLKKRRIIKKHLSQASTSAELSQEILDSEESDQPEPEIEMVCCFVPDCNHYSENQNRICSHFFRFPKDEILRKKWIKNIRRGDKEPSEHSMVCSCHFKDGKSTNDPTIFKRNEVKIMKYSSLAKRKRKPSDLKAISLPSTSAEKTTCKNTHPKEMTREPGASICITKEAISLLPTSAEKTTEYISSKRLQRKPDVLGADSSLPSTSSQGTSCDKSIQTDCCPSLHLQLQEREKLRAELEILKTFVFSGTDIKDKDNDLEPTPNRADYSSQVYQFKVSLQHIKPQIWRRIQVPADFNFRELHLAIQCAMGWENYHLYMFRMGKKKINLGNSFFPFFEDDIRIGNELDGEDIISALDVKLPEYFKHEKSQGVYEYDFGQSWMHDVVLEKILPRIEGEAYPKCIDGKRACPPEDCAFPPSDSEDDDETRDWKRKRRDPELFDLEAVKFDFELIDNDF